VGKVQEWALAESDTIAQGKNGPATKVHRLDRKAVC